MLPIGILIISAIVSVCLSAPDYDLGEIICGVYILGSVLASIIAVIGLLISIF